MCCILQLTENTPYQQPSGFKVIRIGFGGTRGCFALEFHSDLTSGRCLPSLTYGDTSSLASAADFLCESVQLWAVTGGVGGSSRTGMCVPWGAQAGRGVLEPGQNKLMLEFVGMEKEVAMLRRFAG